MKRSVRLAAGAVLALVLSASPGHAREPKMGAGRDPGGAPDGMTSFPATDSQTVGISDKDLERILKRDLDTILVQKRTWPVLWEQVFLFSTPEHQVPVPAFWLGRYEVTNAQWQVFFDDPLNQVPGAMTTNADLNTLEALVSRKYGLDSGKDFQSAWLFLMHLNWERLSAHLNKAELADWDPLQSQAQKLPIPDGIRIDATRYLPPTYWDNGKPKDEDLSRPVHGVSWNQALDFCEWAGFHLPLEREWERAARGSEARRFPWGNEWDPVKCLWKGFNAAIQKAKSDKPPVGNPQFVPSHAAAVDDPNFADGATPEGLRHMAGNVSEWMIGLARKYPESKSSFRFENHSRMARGANFTDGAEHMLSTDRIWDGPQGAFTADITLGGYGLRLAGYPNAGADLTLFPAALYTLPNAMDGPTMWLPKHPPKVPARLVRKEGLFRGLHHGSTAGILTRQLVRNTGNHIYVKGPAKGVALLPVRGLPPGSVKNIADLHRATHSDEDVVLLGVLVGTRNLEMELVRPVKPVEPGERVEPDDGDGEELEPEVEKFTVKFSDPRFRWRERLPGARSRHVGALVVLRAERVAIYTPDPSAVGAPDSYLKREPLGYLEIPYEAVFEKGVAPAGKYENGEAVLTVPLPLLDTGGKRPKMKTTKSFAITIRVPLKGY